MTTTNTVVEFPSLSELDRQFEEIEKQRELIREQARQIEVLKNEVSQRGLTKGNHLLTSTHVNSTP